MNLFGEIPRSKVPRSVFNISESHKMSADIGKLIPVYVQQVLPGDKWMFNSAFMMRWAPLLAPIMHDVDVFFDAFFVPERLLWKHWEQFIAPQMEPGSSEPPVVPVKPYIVREASCSPDDSLYGYGSLADYMGLPVEQVISDTESEPFITNLEHDASFFKAYQFIWNEFYRDQNLQEPIDIKSDEDGQLSSPVGELLKLRSVAYKKDYFTGALPWLQRGEDVEMPLLGTAPVLMNDSDNPVTLHSVTEYNGFTPFEGPLSSKAYIDSESGGASYASLSGGNAPLPQPAQGSTLATYKLDPNGTLYADLNEASSFTINELRRANAVQRFLENSARGGGRYIEFILSHFNVRSSDARLQRPEFLGGYKAPLVINTIFQNSASTETSAQANPAGNAQASGYGLNVRRYFEEHGILMVLMYIRPKSLYMQGLLPKFTKFDRLDYAFPTLANIGEQAVKNSELYFDPYAPKEENDTTFGYVPRYSEYKTGFSQVHGDFLHSLSYWHMGRIFANRPALNGQFVTVDGGAVDRVFAVQDEGVQKVWVQVDTWARALRPLPRYGVPMLR